MPWVGNCFLKPLLHIKGSRSEEDTKRIVELTTLRFPYPIYMEWISGDMITLQPFNKRLWNQGDHTFTNGTQEDLNSIRESWVGKFKECEKLHIYGHYPEGFFAFSNGIYRCIDNEWAFQEVDELGVVEHNNTNYYIPVYSKIHIKQVEGISTSNRLYNFFSTINTLIDKRLIVKGRDFKIEAPGRVTLKKRGSETFEKVLDDPGTQLLFLRIDNIFPEYARIQGKESLSKSSLLNYLLSHESWIGNSKSSRFTWEEVVETVNGIGTNGEAVNTTAKRVISKPVSITSSIVLNYDILKELLSVDYEREAEVETVEEDAKLPF